MESYSLSTNSLYKEALMKNALRLLRYGINNDGDRVNLFYEYIAYILSDGDFLKELIEDELEEYSEGRMSNFQHIFLMVFLEYIKEMEYEKAEKITDDLLEKPARPLTKQEMEKLSCHKDITKHNAYFWKLFKDMSVIYH